MVQSDRQSLLNELEFPRQNFIETRRNAERFCLDEVFAESGQILALQLTGQ